VTNTLPVFCVRWHSDTGMDRAGALWHRNAAHALRDVVAVSARLARFSLRGDAVRRCMLFYVLT